MIVFDASTMILIAKIDLLNAFLAGVRTEVAIPKAVEEECCSVRRSYDAIAIRKALDEAKIVVNPLKDRRIVTKIRDDFNLGLGEAEAISLAHRERASLIGIDDRNGIKACKLLGLPFTTAIGILVRSYENRLLGQNEAIEKLASLGKYAWYENAFIEDAKRRLERQL
jgi:predicted nucleic acid-binding protein